MSELERINKERDSQIKMLQGSCSHEKTKIVDVKWGEDEDHNWDMSEGLMCTFCGKILKRINPDYKHTCLHEFESMGLLGKTGDVYRCKKCGNLIDMTEDDDF